MSLQSRRRWKPPSTLITSPVLNGKKSDAIAATALVYAIYRYRVNQIIKLERVRTRIATDLHDDIGSSLSKIAILSEVVRQKNGANGARVRGGATIGT